MSPAKFMTRALAVWLTAFAGMFTGTHAQETDSHDDLAFFEQRIRPVLVNHCYECHSNDSRSLKGGLRVDDREAIRRGGDSGPAVVPGRVDESLLMAAIAYDGGLYDMPPAGKLPDAVIADFRNWIERGAADPREASSNSKDATEARDIQEPLAAESLWAAIPLAQATPPKATNADWPRNEIDCFVLAELEAHRLQPAPATDRLVWLRRVTYDLTGLPPTAEEMQAFVHDATPHAYERVVDRLLGSPAFGDHWARMWLDLACYADLADVQGNVVVQGAWRYRDYVIQSFNEDKPFDQFIREQIAGDLLPAATPAQQREQLVATGFLSIGPWALQNYEKQQLQADVVDHQIDKVCQTFLGMSVRCARCHDHKFDPISAEDYYALAGIFQSTLTTRYDGPGVWSQVVSRPLPHVEDDVWNKQHLATMAHLNEQRAQLAQERQTRLNAEAPARLSQKVTSATANSLTLLRGINANDAHVNYRVSFTAGPTTWSDPSQATTADDGLLIQILRVDGTAVASYEHRPGDWNAEGVERGALMPASFDYTGDGTGPVFIHITASPLHTNRFGGALDELKVERLGGNETLFEESFDAYEPTSTIGKQADTGARVFAAGSWTHWAGAGINPSHAVELPSDKDHTNYALQIFSGLPGSSSDPRVADLDAQLSTVNQRLQLLAFSRPEWTTALAVQDVASPADAPVYLRGNYRAVGKVVPRGALGSIAHGRQLKITQDTSGRRELADWIVSSHNSVTPRVLVNRFWSQMIGAGLVRSVDYWGTQAQRPSHPELLDWLAVQFREKDHWSLKRFLRRVALSSVYRMSSELEESALKMDPDNRLLWRMNRRRLTAESIRDAMQMISGRLDRGRGGPSLGLDLPGNVSGIGDQVNLPTYSSGQIPAQVVSRRAIYLPLLRSRPTGELEILSVFDFPHPSEVTGRRAERTVPTQALFLLNAPFVKDRARWTAERLTQSLDGEMLSQATRMQLVRQIYLRMINREPDDHEMKAAVDYLAMPDGGPPENRAALQEQLASLCHALFASNSFLFKE